MNRGVQPRVSGRGTEIQTGAGERAGTEAERIRAAERYLSEYRTAYRMLKAGMEGFCRDSRRGGWGSVGQERGQSHLLAATHMTLSDDDRMWEEKLEAIRATVLAVAEPDQKIFLFQHYIRGNTVEACAEILDISVRTAFRLKKRALLTVSEMI